MHLLHFAALIDHAWKDTSHSDDCDNLHATYSQSTWLNEFDNEGAHSLSQRMEEFLDLSTAWPHSEECHVSNYGPGGQYNAHYDMNVLSPDNMENEFGDRIATVSKGGSKQIIDYDHKYFYIGSYIKWERILSLFFFAGSCISN